METLRGRLSKSVPIEPPRDDIGAQPSAAAIANPPHAGVPLSPDRVGSTRSDAMELRSSQARPYVDRRPSQPGSTRSSRVICVVNRKGGVGKTTTAFNLAGTLAIDLTIEFERRSPRKVELCLGLFQHSRRSRKFLDPGSDDPLLAFDRQKVVSIIKE